MCSRAPKLPLSGERIRVGVYSTAEVVLMDTGVVVIKETDFSVPETPKERWLSFLVDGEAYKKYLTS